MSDDVGEGGLAQTRGAVQQHMVERLAAHECRLDEDLQVVDDLVLSGECLQILWTDAVLELQIALYVSHVSVSAHDAFCGRVSIGCRLWLSSFPAVDGYKYSESREQRQIENAVFGFDFAEAPPIFRKYSESRERRRIGTQFSELALPRRLLYSGNIV